MSGELARAGHDFVIVDGASRVATSWRRLWASVRLFTSARHSNLPGLPFPAASDHLPGKDNVAQYLTGYVDHFALPVQLDTTVRQLRRSMAGSMRPPPAAGSSLAPS